MRRWAHAQHHSGVDGSELHGRAAPGGRQGGGDRSAGGEAARGKEGVRAAAQALGGGAQFRVDGEVSAAEPGLRAAAAGVGGAAFRGLRDAHSAQGCGISRLGGAGCKSITRSRAARLAQRGEDSTGARCRVSGFSSARHFEITDVRVIPTAACRPRLLTTAHL